MLDRVTWHAVRRYLERVWEVDVPRSCSGMGEQAVATAMCEAAGVSPDQVRAAVMTNSVREVCIIAPSHATVPVDGARAVVCDGVVVTIQHGKTVERHAPQRLKVMCESESKRHKARLRRRRRRRP